MPTRKERKSATRERLIAVARQRFRRDGYDATTMAVVARDAGVSVGSVCVHFGDKRAMLVAAFIDVISAELEAGWVSAPRGSLAETIDHMAAKIFPVFAENASGLELLRELTFAVGPTRAHVDAVHSKWMSIFIECIHRKSAPEQISSGKNQVVNALFPVWFTMIGGLRDCSDDVDKWIHSLSELRQMREGVSVDATYERASPSPRRRRWTPEWD